MQNSVCTQYMVWISVVSHSYIVELPDFATAPVFSARSLSGGSDRENPLDICLCGCYTTDVTVIRKER